jgi:hypothetical protein
VYATAATTTTGTGQAAYYSGSSNTAIETTTAFTTLNLGTANQTEIEVGRRSTPAEAFTVYVATVQTNDGLASLIPADTVYDQINDLTSVSNLAATFDEILELTGVAASAGTYDQITEITAVAPLSGTLTVNAGLDAAFEPNTVAKLNVTLNAAPASVVWAQTGGLVVTLIGSGRNRAYLTPAVLTSSTTLTFTVTVTPAGGGSPVTDTVVHTVYPHQVWQLNAARTKVPVFLGGTPLALPDPDSTP